ncbi:MAG TPA: hypothetical protein ENK01_01115 [Hellea balneolensis]|uniref:Thioredoxin domain-containing protein n=1 Tax=Hellea balneolensis TaxID=287478 RepID=A0A7V5NWE4_9PROT|nr:hypothetical protein [Hellea balneolensis]
MYNYPDFSPNLYDYKHKTGLRPGEKVPDVAVQSPDGEIIPLKKLFDHVTVLETGSLTCPLYIGKIKSMNTLAKKHKNINFAVVYIREAHPGNRLCAVDSDSLKRARAQSLTRYEAENRKIYVDTLDGALHHALGLLPNMVYVIDTDGAVLHRSDWNNPDRLDHILMAIENGQKFPAWCEEFEPVPVKTTLRVLFRAGGIRAVADFLSHLPAMIREKRRIDEKDPAQNPLHC